MTLKTGNKTGLVYFDMKDLRSWKPCYDPNRYLPEDFRGTAIDILENETIPHCDRTWAVLRNEICSDRLMRLFAVWSARQVQHLMTDPRSLAMLDVAERFANGEATEEELRAAHVSAVDAYNGFSSAAWAATSAGMAAAYAASDVASVSARMAAAHAACVTRGDAESAQRAKLIEMLQAEGLERLAAKRERGRKK